jgi:hypothetical protein
LPRTLYLDFLEAEPPDESLTVSGHRTAIPQPIARTHVEVMIYELRRGRSSDPLASTVLDEECELEMWHLKGEGSYLTSCLIDDNEAGSVLIARVLCSNLQGPTNPWIV